ncbi:hypothetical protein ABID21_003649 [Pseudorhizobium tarimense]|uniref:Uncharacterized protein n=1 Tax=Pseudorhizobium tarimense TaxID=1079109 RepID=A0ABV2HAI5_9HYPH|nr:hypothetical protein [Pseudorhizobium tarimense]MCJ8520484.1 hypothetical protein [Pseudorhizobium tarimense]
MASQERHLAEQALAEDVTPMPIEHAAYELALRELVKPGSAAAASSRAAPRSVAVALANPACVVAGLALHRLSIAEG